MRFSDAFIAIYLGSLQTYLEQLLPVSSRQCSNPTQKFLHKIRYRYQTLIDPPHIILLLYRPSESMAQSQVENKGHAATYAAAKQRSVPASECWSGARSRMIPLSLGGGVKDGKKLRGDDDDGTDTDPGMLLPGRFFCSLLADRS